MEDFAAYEITMKTYSEPGSGVSGRTYITIHGDDGSSERIMFIHGLAEGSRITKTVIALDVGVVSSIELSHDGTGSKLEWRPSEVVVKNLNAFSASHFLPTMTIGLSVVLIRGEATPTILSSYVLTYY